MKIIKIDDKSYPEQLRNIQMAPQKLYVLGNEKILNKKSVAIVGSRNCTQYGEVTAFKFSEELAKQGLVITSGMAIGIDSYAHKGCLSQNGKTIAVLGCGFNKLYPKENKELFNKIIDTGGAVVSEYSLSVEPCAENFRKRNRIVSGLSSAVLIVEAEYRSGTSITANYAKKQGKPVFCVPSSIQNSKGIGTNEMLKNGAYIATCANDILDKLDINENKEKHIDNKKEKINKEFIPIYNILNKEPISTNEISKELKLAINEINSKLLLMEMDGLVKRVSGNNYIKIL